MWVRTNYTIPFLVGNPSYRAHFSFPYLIGISDNIHVEALETDVVMPSSVFGNTEMYIPRRYDENERERTDAELLKENNHVLDYFLWCFEGYDSLPPIRPPLCDLSGILPSKPFTFDTNSPSRRLRERLWVKRNNTAQYFPAQDYSEIVLVGKPSHLYLNASGISMYNTWEFTGGIYLDSEYNSQKPRRSEDERLADVYHAFDYFMWCLEETDAHAPTRPFICDFSGVLPSKPFKFYPGISERDPVEVVNPLVEMKVEQHTTHSIDFTDVFRGARLVYEVSSDNRSAVPVEFGEITIDAHGEQRGHIRLHAGKPGVAKITVRAKNDYSTAHTTFDVIVVKSLTPK